LSERGVFYANVNTDTSGEDDTWRGFPLVKRSLDFYARMGEEGGLTIEDMGSLRSVGHLDVPAQDHKRMLRITSF
jgi:hypothetical protein